MCLSSSDVCNAPTVYYADLRTNICFSAYNSSKSCELNSLQLPVAANANGLVHLAGPIGHWDSDNALRIGEWHLLPTLRGTGGEPPRRKLIDSIAVICVACAVAGPSRLLPSTRDLVGS